MNLVLIKKENAIGNVIYKMDFNYYLSQIPKESMRRRHDGVVIVECPKCHQHALLLIRDKQGAYCKHCNNTFVHDGTCQNETL